MLAGVVSALGAVSLRGKSDTGHVANPEPKTPITQVEPNPQVHDAPPPQHTVVPVPQPPLPKADAPRIQKLPGPGETEDAPKPKAPLPETPAELDKEGSTFLESKSYPQAGAAFNEACVLGSTRSCGRLAEMTAKGEGVPKDPRRVAELRTKACDGGDMGECYHLSFNYQAGDGVVADKAKTESLRGHACNGGVGEACESLGAMYLTDPDFKSEQKAATYFQLGCDLNSKESCWYMGKLFDLGKGVPKDPAKAKAMYARSCTLGYQKSCGTGQSQ